MPVLWDSSQIQPQTVPFCLLATPVRGSLKSPYTVGIAVRCEPRRGSSTTPPLIPAIIIGRRMPVDLKRFFPLCKPCPKPPKLRLNAIGRIGNLPCQQNRNNGRNLGSQGGNKKDRRKSCSLRLTCSVYIVSVGPDSSGVLDNVSFRRKSIPSIQFS